MQQQTKSKNNGEEYPGCYRGFSYRHGKAKAQKSPTQRKNDCENISEYSNSKKQKTIRKNRRQKN